MTTPNTRPPLWRIQLDAIHPTYQQEAFNSIEQHLIDDAGIELGSAELLLARLAVGNYVVRGSDGAELQGRPVDINEAAQFQGIELPPHKVSSVDAALSDTLPRIVRMWGKERATTDPAPSADGIRTYLNAVEMSHGFLDKEEEQQLMLLSAQGKALEGLDKLTKRQKEVLEAAQDARNKLVLHNLKFAVHYAKRYLSSGYDMEDLIQVANTGLIKAAQTVMPGMQARFTTYAGKCMENEFKHFLSQGKTGVRIKTGYFETRRFVQTEQELTEKLGRRPTVEELLDHDHYGELSADRIWRLRQNAALLQQIPLTETWKEEKPADELNTDYLSRTPPAQRLRPLPEDETFEQIASEMLIAQLHLVLDTLSEREADVIRMRFGLNEDEQPMSLDEIGNVYGLTAERIRQIESKARMKLRHPSRSDILKKYFE